MKRNGAWLAVRALEQLGVRTTFGIPGVHNIELYDALDRSEYITPVLTTHELSAAFMADAISRTTDSIGCLAIVPAAGLTHAMSGIGEAFLAGVPMLVLTGGIRRDTGRHYQLHHVDQQQLAAAITKGAFLVTEHEEIVPTIYEAYELATSAEPGPVLVELPGEVQMFSTAVGEIPAYERRWRPPPVDAEKIRDAAQLLLDCERPGLYLGWGAREATGEAIEIAELLGMPVSTTLQGLSVFPGYHPLHTGVSFGPSAVPAAQKAFEHCDGLLAVGLRFAEIATASYGMSIPAKLIHIDINEEVFHKNYPASVAIEADAREALRALVMELGRQGIQPREPTALHQLVAKEKEAYRASWTRRPSKKKVSPGIFFRELRKRLADEAFLIVDDGNHTWLAAEQFPVFRSKHFLCPTDFNSMGYAVPAAIAVKLAHPDKQVVAVVGDGGFLMTGMELITAATRELGIAVFVFHDGELAQISQFQKLPLGKKACTVLGELHLPGVALATGAAALAMPQDDEVGPVIDEALVTAHEGKPVLVDVNIDYSRKTRLTEGVIKVNLGRFPVSEKLRYVGRAIKRKLIG
ncbi:MAG: thiamine pyrophosphate-binding protein [Acidobacteriota bacterium]|nr:MAG: thiamine pyrophosphate-binding protein [Acidobacteriota bacterium]